MYVYILLLKTNKYYIGKTSNIQKRYEQHCDGIGSEWTRKYPPEDLVDVVSNSHEFTELAMTLTYMKQYGIDNVRGATYCSIVLSDKERKEIERHIKAEMNMCFQCGKEGHFISECRYKEVSFFSRIYDWIYYKCFHKDIEDEYMLMRDTNIITFGKYSGFTYEEILERDPIYCNSLVATTSKNKDFIKFQNWLLSNKVS